MKTLITLILIVCTQSVIFGQKKGAGSKHKEEQLNLCVVNYADGKWIITHNETTGDHQCDDLVIKSLPTLQQGNTPLELNMEYQGFYTIKKDPSLMLTDDYHVLIQDVLTGEFYNLNSTEAYPFKINKATNDTRFRMEIKKNKNSKSLNGATASNN